tara:strand:- start:2869 stop:2979 length:111 start_codon:yes stop_codon:yes gene_type:complete
MGICIGAIASIIFIGIFWQYFAIAFVFAYFILVIND